MIRVSAGEFAATVTKACLGAGIERGVAAEIGPACMELSLLGLRPLPVLTAHLGGNPHNATFNQENWRQAENRWTAPGVSSLADAVSMIDFASICEGGASSPGVKIPIFVIGLAVNRMRCHGVAYEVSLNSADWLQAFDAADVCSRETNSCAFALRLQSLDGGTGLRDIVAIDVLEDDWRSLDDWVAKTLVKADDTNRADAGAGNTDND